LIEGFYRGNFVVEVYFDSLRQPLKVSEGFDVLSELDQLKIYFGQVSSPESPLLILSQYYLQNSYIGNTICPYGEGP